MRPKISLQRKHLSGLQASYLTRAHTKEENWSSKRGVADSRRFSRCGNQAHQGQFSTTHDHTPANEGSRIHS